jgi:hypothetical protein
MDDMGILMGRLSSSTIFSQDGSVEALEAWMATLRMKSLGNAYGLDGFWFSGGQWVCRHYWPDTI